MKRAFTIFLFLLASTSRAQSGPEFWNLSLTDSSLRILYIGVENRLQLSGVKKTEEITLTIEGAGANIEQVKPAQFIVRASVTGQATLSVFRLGKLLKKIVFDVKIIESAVAGLNSNRNTTIRKSQLFAAPRLNLYFEQAKLRLNYAVVSFTMRTELNGDSIFLDSENDQLTPQQLAVIRQLNTGSEVVFERIRTNGPEGRTVTFYSFWIKIE